MNNKALKQKKCKSCREPFTPYNSLEKVCGVKCAIKLAENDRDKRERKETRARKIAIKTKSEWLKDAQKEFNSFIRERDNKEPCISCGRYHQGQYHAGHYRSVGACPELRFEENNCHKQCAPCNNNLSGNIVEYRLRLIEKIGISELDWLEGPHQVKKYSIDEIKEITKKYKAKFKELKQIRGLENE